MTTKKIIFDLDGTIVDLYTVKNWLSRLRTNDPTPFTEAKPLFKLQPLARRLNNLQKKGYTIGIITWTSKGASKDFHKDCAHFKKKWLKKHLKSVKWDFMEIVPYGTPKHSLHEGILFDDNENVRSEWIGKAYPENRIREILEGL